MNLSIIIVNYNTKNLLKQCLNSLLEHPTKSSEIIVIDNASTDGSVEMLRKENLELREPGRLPELSETPKSIESVFNKITLIKNKTNRGFGTANNQGAKIAKGKYLLFLNPDTRIKRGFDELLEYMEKNPKVGVLGCRLVDENGREQPHIAGFKHNVFSAITDKISPLAKGHLGGEVRKHLRGGGIGERDMSVIAVDWVTGACMLIRRKVFEELKGFDERFFMYFEDEDLCLRAKEKGWGVIYYPRFSIVHAGGASLGKNKKSRYDYYFQSQDLFYKKHHKIWQRLLLRIMRYPFRVFFRKNR